MPKLESLLNKLFSKKVILVQNFDGSVNIYSSFNNIKKNTQLNKYINSDMTLKATSIEIDNQMVNIYTADLKGDNSHLNDACLWAVNRLQHEGKKYFNINVFGAYILNPRF